MTDDTLIADLIKAGVDPELVNRVANAIAEALRRNSAEIPQKKVDVSAERRRRKDLERYYAKKLRRNSADDIPVSFLLTSSNSTSLRKVEREVVTRARPEFDQFWEAYPHKVGKLAAAKAFGVARKRVELGALMAALGHYAGKTDDRPWCNPATWLNQGRWDDKPGTAPAPREAPAPRLGSWQDRQEKLEHAKAKLKAFIARGEDGGGSNGEPTFGLLSLGHTPRP